MEWAGFRRQVSAGSKRANFRRNVYVGSMRNIKRLVTEDRSMWKARGMDGFKRQVYSGCKQQTKGISRMVPSSNISQKMATYIML
jgi:hypothetical protein